jgi:hypothetical protein
MTADLHLCIQSFGSDTVLAAPRRKRWLQDPALKLITKALLMQQQNCCGFHLIGKNWRFPSLI